ncbi:MAG: sigma-70 family RNA polymerase sigma factor [Verrucomicrobia bacterium]|nr:sigma-70 family RNA polymerase sigma factor [Verrucomicrobiota bacterium]
MSDQNPGLGSTLATRPTLLFRIRDWQDGESWEEFHRLYRRLIHGRACRAGLAHADAEDVAQEVLKRVAETIRDFDYDPKRGSFRGWLMQLTQWRIANKLAHRAKAEAPRPQPSEGGNDGVAAVERLLAPANEDDEWDREWQLHLLAAAAERLARKVKPQHFQVFDLYVQQQWPVLEVAQELGINPASVYLIGHRLTKQLKAEVEKLQAQLG